MAIASGSCATTTLLTTPSIGAADRLARIRTLRDPGRFEPWLHRILTNACYAEARRRSRWSERVRLSPSACARARRVPDRRQPRPVRAAFRRLTVEQRAVLVSTTTSASRFRRWRLNRNSRRDVKSRMHHAKRALRAIIEANAGRARPRGSERHDRTPRPRSPDPRLPLGRRRAAERPGLTTWCVPRSREHKRQRTFIGLWRRPTMNKLVTYGPRRRCRGRPHLRWFPVFRFA